VVFSHFSDDRVPDVKVEQNSVRVKHFDTLLGQEVDFEADFLILSTGILPGDENENLAKVLKVPLDGNGFFLEAHAKIRPLDFTAEGMYFCGLSHSPRFLHEALMQAQGAAARAVTVLSKESIEAKAITATVNERTCKACGLCITACPYHAREMDDEKNIARVIETLCQGCGACVVTCPSGATKHRGFDKKQIMAMVDQAV
jgi:heterodisulfide reductase subunit A-like polyferredoxin